MIQIFTVPGCPSCRKVKNALKEKEIEYQEHHLFSLLLDQKSLTKIWNGSIDFKNWRTQYNQEDWSLSQIFTYLQNNPSILPRPILLIEENLSYKEKIEGILDNKNSFCPSSCLQYSFCKQVRHGKDFEIWMIREE